MTKKDLMTLAKLINEHTSNISEDNETNQYYIHRDQFLDALLKTFVKDNPKFEREIILASGIDAIFIKV